MDLRREAERATRMLKGKVVSVVWRHRKKEIGIQFIDGTRFFIDHQLNGLRLSISGGKENAR